MNSRRNLKRFLFGLAGVIVVMVLVGVEENGRSRHAWDRFKQEQAARGEKLDFKDFIPPPVPDDQNFAATPIVASSYQGPSRGFLSAGDTNVFKLPEVTTDDRAYWGEGRAHHGDWPMAKMTDLQGWQEYYRWLAALTNEFVVPPQPQSPPRDVLLALSKWDPTIDVLRQAAARPYSRFPLDYDKIELSAIPFPHLEVLKRCVLVLELRATAELQAGETDRASDDVKLAMRLADSIHAEPYLSSQSMRLLLWQTALQPLYEGLAGHKWSEAQLAAFDQELGKLDFLADYEFSMRSERALEISEMEYLRRTRNVQILDYAASRSYNGPFLKMAFRLAPAAFFYRNELAAARMHEQWTLPAVDVEHRMVSPKVVQQNDTAADNALDHFAGDTVLARLMFPAVSKTVEKYARTQSSADLARLAIALERYRLAHGGYPESLEALAPQFMEKIPLDVIDGQPLHYRRDPQSSDAAGGRFILYSAGWNEQDDGGAVVAGKTKAIDYKSGDLVWRYPEK